MHDCVQRMELEAVKRERSHLMASLAEIKTQSGKAGGELQQEDVRRLRKEVELKMEKLNEIRKVRLLLTDLLHARHAVHGYDRHDNLSVWKPYSCAP